MKKITLLAATPLLLAFVQPNRTMSSVNPSFAADTSAKAAYEANCKKCHGVKGTPPKTMVTKFPKIVAFDAEFLAKVSDDSVVKVLTKGSSKDMKSFKDKLSADEMKAVAAYIRTFGK